jgi:hypothetical protein
MSVRHHLLTCWKFDENTGSTAADATGNGYTASLQNSPSWVSGVDGSALDYNGSNQYCSTTFAATLMPATIISWIKADSIAPYEAWIFHRSASTFGFHVSNAGTNLAYSWDCPVPTQTYLWESGLTIPTDGSWIFAALVVEASKATIYKGAGGSLSSAVNTLANPPHSSASVSSVFEIGRDSFGTRLFDGSVDEVCVYNIALTAADIEKHYYSGAGKFYPFSGFGSGRVIGGGF